MDFFQRQDAARASTAKLVCLMFGGVTCVVAVVCVLFSTIAPSVFFKGRTLEDITLFQVQDVKWDQFAILSLGVLTFIVTAIFYKISVLATSKGHGIAESLGGRRVDHATKDPQERVLLNVVEEMAIASGVPVPAVYIMDHEQSINAFAAGFRHDEAVVGVTKGSVTTLTRDELQGIIGHEFSHILNGDMKLNLRLIGVLFGLLVLSELGRIILRSARRGRSKKNGGQVILIGVGLCVIGEIGYVFGVLIQAAISRQREFLADASSVQFTRNPLGLAGAFKKIQGLEDTTLSAGSAGQVRHMLFVSGFRHWFGSLTATHPPMEERLEALTGQKYTGTMGHLPAPVAGSPLVSGLSPAAAVNKIGTVAPENLQRAEAWMKNLDAKVSKAARDPLDATALVLALLISQDGNVAKKQARVISERNEVMAGIARNLFDGVSQLKVKERLSVIDLSMPALLTLSNEQRQFLLDTAELLIRADEKIDLFEYTLLKILKNRLMRGRTRHLAKHQPKATVAAATLILSAVSSASHSDPNQCAVAFKAAAGRLPGNALSSTTPVLWNYEQLDDALTCLDQLLPLRKKTLLDACAHAISHDGVVSDGEAQIFRAVSEAVGCPTSL